MAREGKPLFWTVSQENSKFYSQAQQAQHQTDSSYTIQAQPLKSQAKAQAPVQAQNEVGIQHQPPQFAQAQAQTQPQVAVDQAVDQAPAQGPAPFPVQSPQRRQLPVVVPHRDMDPFTEEDDSFSIDLENGPILREKEARSEVLDKVVLSITMGECPVEKRDHGHAETCLQCPEEERH